MGLGFSPFQTHVIHIDNDESKVIYMFLYVFYMFVQMNFKRLGGKYYSVISVFLFILHLIWH